MSQFGTTDNVSGTIDLAQITKKNESEVKSLSNSKGIKRPTFEGTIEVIKHLRIH